MSLRLIHLVIGAYGVAATCAVVACADTVSFVASPRDGGDADANTTDDASADAGDAFAIPDGAGYVPDLGPQSAALQINASHTGSTKDPTLFGPVARRWSRDLSGPLSFPLIAHDKIVVTFVTAAKHAAVRAFDALTGASVWGPIDLGASPTVA